MCSTLATTSTFGVIWNPSPPDFAEGDRTTQVDTAGFDPPRGIIDLAAELDLGEQAVVDRRAPIDCRRSRSWSRLRR